MHMYLFLLHALCSQINQKEYDDEIIKHLSLKFKCKFYVPNEYVCAKNLGDIQTKLKQSNDIKKNDTFHVIRLKTKQTS